jgi:hypothetical protein
MSRSAALPHRKHLHYGGSGAPLTHKRWMSFRAAYIYMKIRYLGPAFIDSAQSLMCEFKNDTSNTLLILGATIIAANGYDYDSITRGYDKVIIYNQENYNGLKSTDWFGRYIDILRKADEVWDYTETNIPLFMADGIISTLHVLKPYMNWHMYAVPDKDIDILCYGTMTDRRQSLVDFLSHKYNVVNLGCHINEDKPGVFGTELDTYILRSKILLNVHGLDDNHEQEQARMVRWLGAPCRIISEKSAHNYLGVPEMEYWELFLL